MQDRQSYDFSEGIQDGLPIALGYLSVSFSFGIMAANMGFPGLAAVCMSFTNLTSAGQFAGLKLITEGCGLLELALAQFVINLRYSLMALSLSQKADESVTTKHRLLLSCFITDEIFAVSCAKEKEVSRRYLYGLGLLPLIGWTLGTFFGFVAGEILPASLTSALGVALFGMFVAIIIPPAKKSRPVCLVLLVAAGLSCLLRFVPVFSFLSSGMVIILCAVAAAALGAWFFPISE